MPQTEFASLKATLAKPVEQEEQLVYLLVEVRRVIESTRERFRILKFFCDWVLHAQMTMGGAKTIIGVFDSFVEGSLTNPSMALRMMQIAYPLTSLTGFRTDLIVFLGEHGLDPSLGCDFKRWERFLGLYVDRIAKTPLVVSSFKHLDEIKVRKLAIPSTRQRDDGERFIFGIEWLFNYQGITRQSLVNDVCEPPNPANISFTIKRFERHGEQIISVPQESKTFWKP